LPAEGGPADGFLAQGCGAVSDVPRGCGSGPTSAGIQRVPPALLKRAAGGCARRRCRWPRPGHWAAHCRPEPQGGHLPRWEQRLPRLRWVREERPEPLAARDG